LQVMTMQDELPQFSMPPAPPDSFFQNPAWVARLVRYGMPAEVAWRVAERVARKAYMMPPDMQERYLRSVCDVNKLPGRTHDD